MKLYTEKQVLKLLERYKDDFYRKYVPIDKLVELESYIELPSDEEIKTYLNNHSYEFEHGFKDAIEFIKNKIQGVNK